MTWPNIIGLGEVMNFPGVAANDPVMSARSPRRVQAGKTVGGHYASRDLGLPFHGYVAGGPADDHEGTRAEDAIARVRQGMKAMLRLGSAWYDVAAQIKAVTEQGHRPPQLHPVHRRLPFRHAGPRRPYGPRGAPRHRARAEAGHRDPDGDPQHRPAFRAGARARLDRAGPAGRFLIVSDLPACRSTRSWPRRACWPKARQARGRHSRLRLSGRAPRTR